ncbi:MAG TPA: arginine repressor [Actinomycetota bacterium]|nr:arginine repressor [Actinomycetota bacterium]
MADPMKAQRQRRIVQLLRRQAVSSQEELAKLLRRHGEQVTQATLSRDLEELGAIRMRENGRVVYRLPTEPPAGEDWLQHMLQEFMLEVESSGSLVVVKTPPGGANAVARALDNTGVKDVIGTVAGDDTIMVVCREGVKGQTVARRLRTLAGQFNDIKEA